MIVYDGKTRPFFRILKSRFEYRVLCEYRGKLYVIDSMGVVSYVTFISGLERLLLLMHYNLDMGSGWNHSWRRNNNGNVVEIHFLKHSYTTNWSFFKET